jgi:hypothetical protein
VIAAVKVVAGGAWREICASTPAQRCLVAVVAAALAATAVTPALMPSSATGTGDAARAETAAAPVPPAPRCGQQVVVLYNQSGADRPVEGDLRAAARLLSEGSGREIRYGGLTTARSSAAVPPQPAAVVVVRWVARPAALPGRPGSDTVAVGGATTAGGRLVRGDVVLAAGTSVAPGATAGGGQVLLEHELMHALGVSQHSTSPADVMYPSLLPTKGPALGPGDLRALSRTGCSTDSGVSAVTNGTTTDANTSTLADGVSTTALVEGVTTGVMNTVVNTVTKAINDTTTNRRTT